MKVMLARESDQSEFSFGSYLNPASTGKSNKTTGADSQTIAVRVKIDEDGYESPDTILSLAGDLPAGYMISLTSDFAGRSWGESLNVGTITPSGKLVYIKSKYVGTGSAGAKIRASLVIPQEGIIEQSGTQVTHILSGNILATSDIVYNLTGVVTDRFEVSMTLAGSVMEQFSISHTLEGLVQATSELTHAITGSVFVSGVLELTHDLTGSVMEMFEKAHTITGDILEQFTASHSLTGTILEQLTKSHSLTGTIKAISTLTHSLTGTVTAGSSFTPATYYFRSDNVLGPNVSGSTANNTFGLSEIGDYYQADVDIKVEKWDTDWQEVSAQGAAPKVAFGFGEYSVNYSFPGATSVTNNLKIRITVRITMNGVTTTHLWTTGDLGVKELPAGTWAIKYNMQYVNANDYGESEDELGTDVNFYYGGSAQSRITNFGG